MTGPPDVIAKLQDLLQQATVDRSHYYVGHVVALAINELSVARYKHDLDRSLAEKWRERIDLALIYCGNDDQWAIGHPERLLEVEKILAGDERAIQEAKNEVRRIAEARLRGD